MKIINCQTLGEVCESLLDGEPVFIIRAQDVASVAAIESYKSLSHFNKGANLIRTQAVIDRFKAWQAKHHDRVRAAD